MKRQAIAPPQPQHSTAAIQSVKPLVFDFFVSNRPAQIQQIYKENEIRSYFSQRLENNRSFKPRLNFKKLIQQPNFLLSVERKKIKVINGLGQRTNPEKLIHNHYRGSKVRSSTSKTQHEQDFPQGHSRSLKDQRVQSQELTYRSTPSKAKIPNFPFNLKHLIKSCKVHSPQFKREQHITGCNFPYYSYFSSKSQISRKSSRNSQQNRRNQQRERYFSTMEIKPFLK